MRKKSIRTLHRWNGQSSSMCDVLSYVLQESNMLEGYRRCRQIHKILQECFNPKFKGSLERQSKAQFQRVSIKIKGRL